MNVESALGFRWRTKVSYLPQRSTNIFFLKEKHIYVKNKKPAAKILRRAVRRKSLVGREAKMKSKTKRM
jgi:hypothetical protein